MRRLAFWILLVTAAPAIACAPPAIQFGLGSARIGPGSRWAIDETVSAYRIRPGRRIELRGTTDGLGAADANLRLARRRGEAVKAALVRRGIPARAIDIIAEGEARARPGGVPEDRLVWLAVVDAPARGTATCS